jgi:DNA-binding XRE family transcriptional regulator
MSKLREARVALGLSQERLAELAGTSQSTVNKLETGRMRLTLDYAVRLAPHLGLHPDALMGAAAPPAAGARRPAAGRPAAWPPAPAGAATIGAAGGMAGGAPPASAQRSLPVLSAARGGVDQEMFLEDGAIDWVAMPDYLKNARDPYAIYVVGDSMMPRFRPAQLLHVNPHKPAQPGVGVVLRKRSNAVLIKEFVRQSPEGVVVREYQPEHRDFLVPAEDIASVHTVVGLQEPA